MKTGSGRGRGWTRREALKLGAVAAGAAAVGCGDDGVPPGLLDDAAVGGSPDAGALPFDAAIDPPDAAAPPVDAATSDATETGADAGPAPTADELLAPIDTFVVLCMENRSYDHYLGARSMLEALGGDGLTPLMKNTTAGGLDIFVHALQNFTPADPPHSWDPVHTQWNNGAMDGFVAAHAGASQADVMGYHVRADVPVSWGMADAFTSCDRWFSSVLGPTWPNRLYLHGASSNGVKANAPALGFQSVFQRLTDAGKTHLNYFSDIAWAVGGYLKFGGNATIETFFTAAAAGTLPNYSLIDPGFFGAGANDDHPAHDVRLGQAFIASVYAALRASPQWNRCMLVVTYDEHGGFFDHVPPPETIDERADFRRLGVRVPSLVAGPFVRRGQVVSTTFEHSTIVSTLTRRFGLEPLNARATATADLSSCIDPALLGNPQPGPALPMAPPVNLTALRRLDIQLRAAGRPHSHGELWDLAEAGRIPRHLDRRDRSLQIAEHWLRVGERLGAVDLR